MISRVRGAFNNVTGSADIADDLSDSSATVVIETASVDTRSEDRDNHLRSADFFDVETYPEIRFVSSAIESDPFGNLRAGLEGTRRIDRKDWGVTWNAKLNSGGVLVSDKITLEFELSLIKNVAEATRPIPTKFFLPHRRSSRSSSRLRSLPTSSPRSSRRTNLAVGSSASADPAENPNLSSSHRGWDRCTHRSHPRLLLSPSPCDQTEGVGLPWPS